MSKLKLGILLSTICFTAMQTNVLHAQVPQEITPAYKFVQPLLVVQPRFPANIPSGFTKLEVEISGTIGANGKLRDAKVSAPAGNADFEKEVAEVTSMWRFIPAVDSASCAPKDDAGKVLVIFESSTRNKKYT